MRDGTQIQFLTRADFGARSIRVRPNRYRDLKSSTAERSIPISSAGNALLRQLEALAVTAESEGRDLPFADATVTTTTRMTHLPTRASARVCTTMARVQISGFCAP